jgi:hypothetical protein
LFSDKLRAAVITSNLRINQLSPKTYEWYLTYLKAMDTKNIEWYGMFLADNCVMQFNNNAAVQDKSIIVKFLSDYWATFDSIEHDLLNIYGTDSSFALEALNHYKRNDGKNIILRAVAFTDRNEEGLTTSVRLYTDTTSLFA